MHLQQVKWALISSKTRYVKVIPFVKGRYVKEVHFLSEMAYKSVRVHGPLGKASLYKTELTAPGVYAKE